MKSAFGNAETKLCHRARDLRMIFMVTRRQFSTDNLSGNHKSSPVVAATSFKLNHIERAVGRATVNDDILATRSGQSYLGDHRSDGFLKDVSRVMYNGDNADANLCLLFFHRRSLDPDSWPRVAVKCS